MTHITDAAALADRYDHVIVGGGMVADSAARAILDATPNASVVIIGRDPDLPVTRPALSKKLWTDPDFAFEEVWLETEQLEGCTVLTGTTVSAIDTEAHSVTTDAGRTVGYGSLLLATGAEPVRPDLPSDDRILTFRTLADYRRLRELGGDGRRVAVVGGGYIGTELACALVGVGAEVTLLVDEPQLNASTFPPELAERLTSTFTGHGVTVMPDTSVSGGRATEDGIVLSTADGASTTADVVVVGLGVTASTELAEAAGITCDDGIVVDDRMRTGTADVFAAGDVASYPDRLLGRRRVEHVDNATAMGEHVGAVMAGSDEPYDHTPMYYSELFGTRYEAVGTLDADLAITTVWSDDRSALVAYYRDTEAAGSPVAGVLLWNVADATDAARSVIDDSQQRELTDDELRDRIPPAT